MEPGEYEVLVGASCVDIRLRAQLTRTGPRRDEVGGAAVEPGYRTLDDAMLAKLGLEVPPAEGPRPYSENTTWGEVGQSGWLGWLIFSIALSAARREAYKNAAPKPGADPLATAALGDAATLTLTLTLTLAPTLTPTLAPTLTLTLTPTLTLTRSRRLSGRPGRRSLGGRSASFGSEW